MKLFTEIVESSRNELTDISLEELGKFIDVVKKSKTLPKEYLLILQNCKTLGLCIGKTIDEKVINGTPRDFAWMAANFGGTEEMYAEINKWAKKLSKSELRGLPYYLPEPDVQAVITGKKSIDDITMDLETERGRDKVARQYSQLVTAIASKYKNSGLDWNGLVSAGYLGLTKAMNDYHKPDEYVDIEQGNTDKEATKKAKALSFKQYASWRIRQQILNDINDLSRTVRISQYQYEKNKKEGNTKGNFNVVSVDQTLDDEGDTLVDRMLAFSNDNDAFNDRNAGRKWDKIYKKIDSKFSTRVATCFYKFFGLNNYKQMRGVEIAKEMGVTGAAVAMNVKAVMNFLKNDKESREILVDLLSLYTEALISMYPVDTIMDAMISDDILIMLKESTQWCDKRVFNNAMGCALENLETPAREFIINCLEQGMDYIDEHYDGNRLNIVNFLESVYPTECIRRKSDVDLITMMTELSENFKTHNAILD